MNNIFRACGCLCFLYLGLFFTSTPLNAEPTGEIIFVHPLNRSEIWISNVEGTTARKLFRQTFGEIDKIEVQEDGEYVLVVADKAIDINANIRIFLGSYDIYLLDQRHPIRKAKNLTLGRFPGLLDADISSNGDVIFVEQPRLMRIRSDELAKPEPEIELLMDHGDMDISDIVCSPDGKHIAFLTFSVSSSLFLLDFATQNISRIAQNVNSRPVFSPNGKQIAFSTYVERNGEVWTKGIAVAPVQPDADAEIVHFKEDYIYNVDAWSPDGKFIAYGSYIDPKRINNIELFRSRGNFVVPVTGGEPEPILITMKATVPSLDWKDRAYAVEPANALVTTWGALKARKTVSASSVWR